MRRLIAAAAAALFTLLVAAGPMLACGGLIGPNGAVNLLRTTTFAGYHDGVEHYVTAFAVRRRRRQVRQHHPAAGHPDQRRARRRLDAPAPRPRDHAPSRRFALAAPSAAGAAATDAQVILDDQGRRARHHGPQGRRRRGRRVGHGARLPPAAGRPRGPRLLRRPQPDLPRRRFDADAAQARGQQIGDGTPVHITIPTDNPWVPLRILGLGKVAGDTVSADVYLMTDVRPSLLPTPDRSAAFASTTTSGQRPRSWTTFAPTRAWSGSRIGLADEDRHRRRPGDASRTTSRSTPAAGTPVGRRRGPRAQLAKPVTPGGADENTRWGCCRAALHRLRALASSPG